MRPVSEWTIDDLDALIRDGVQESHTLDYKRSAALARTDGCRKELSKDVSAFANSSGGLLVYGIEEQNHLPTSLDDGVSADISREWIEHTIDGTVRPRIDGLRVKVIDGADGRRYVAIEAPQATVHAPHQASDQRYYRRGNFKSEPMQDYEVRDAFRRSTTPELVLRFTAEPADQESGAFYFRLIVSVGNLSSEPALYSAVDLTFPSRLQAAEIGSQWRREDRLIETPQLRDTVHHFSRLLTVPQHMPIYRERDWAIGEFLIRLSNRDPHGFAYFLNCPGFAADMAAIIQFDGDRDPPVSIETRPREWSLVA